MVKAKTQARQPKKAKKDSNSVKKNIEEILNEVKAAKQELDAEMEDKNEVETTIVQPFDTEDLDSDEELQIALAQKRLKPGLNVVMDAPKKFVNNEEGLKRKLQDIYLNMDWIERLDVTVPKEVVEANVDVAFSSQDLADNDFKREKLFFNQAQSAVVEALKKLKEDNVSTKRPDDYFAEMAKSDDHMKKVKEHLLSKHAELEKREKVRKMRELKKFGKQAQVDAIKKKNLEKKKLSNAVEKVKKGDKEAFDVLAEELGDEKPKRDKKQKKDNEGMRNGERKFEKIKMKTNKKRQHKDKKYGFGGKKKRSKYNTAESSADFSSFKKNVHQGKGKFASKQTAKKFTNKNKPKRGRK